MLLILTPDLFSSSIPAIVEDPVTTSTQGEIVSLETLVPGDVRQGSKYNLSGQSLAFYRRAERKGK